MSCLKAAVSCSSAQHLPMLRDESVPVRVVRMRLSASTRTDFFCLLPTWQPKQRSATIMQIRTISTLDHHGGGFMKQLFGTVRSIPSRKTTMRCGIPSHRRCLLPGLYFLLALDAKMGEVWGSLLCSKAAGLHLLPWIVISTDAA